MNKHTTKKWQLGSLLIVGAVLLSSCGFFRCPQTATVSIKPKPSDYSGGYAKLSKALNSDGAYIKDSQKQFVECNESDPNLLVLTPSDLSRSVTSCSRITCRGIKCHIENWCGEIRVVHVCQLAGSQPRCCLKFGKY